MKQPTPATAIPPKVLAQALALADANGARLEQNLQSGVPMEPGDREQLLAYRQRKQRPQPAK